MCNFKESKNTLFFKNKALIYEGGRHCRSGFMTLSAEPLHEQFTMVLLWRRSLAS
jgi:hypothetical protein